MPDSFVEDRVDSFTPDIQDSFTSDTQDSFLPDEVKLQQVDLSKKIIPQFITGIARQAPMGRTVTKGGTLLPSGIPLEEFPTPTNLPAKIGRGLGELVGMLPSFSVGGFGGGAVAKKVTTKLITQLPRLAKYIAAAAGGATTFTGAKALRNIGQNQPITQGLPQEAGMGAVFGPTGAIRSLPKAIVTSAGLGALIAPKEEKLSQSILFGGLSAITHRRPDLSIQDKVNINKLYTESIAKENIRTVQKRNMGTQKQLPTPETIYGEGFTAKPSGIPVSIQKQLGYKAPEQIGYQSTLEQGAIRQGEGFSVTGGKQIARTIAKGKAQELRTTPTPEETIKTVAQQAPTIVEKIKPQVVSGVVVTPKDLEPISKPTGEGKVKIDKVKPTDWLLLESKKYSVKPAVQDENGKITIGTDHADAYEKSGAKDFSDINSGWIINETGEFLNEKYLRFENGKPVTIERGLQRQREELSTPTEGKVEYSKLTPYEISNMIMGEGRSISKMIPEQAEVTLGKQAKIFTDLTQKGVPISKIQEAIKINSWKLLPGENPQDRFVLSGDKGKYWIEDKSGEVVLSGFSDQYQAKRGLADYLKKLGMPVEYNPNIETQPIEGFIKLSTPTEGKVIDISEPIISKKIGLVKPGKLGESPYMQRGGKIVGLKPEKHLLLPEEKIELLNKLEKEIAKAPEGVAKPVKIDIGNWKLSLIGSKKELTDFRNIVNKRGSVVIPPELIEYPQRVTTQIYRGIAPAGEVLRNDKLVNSIMQENQRKTSAIRSGELPQSLLKQRLQEINDSEKVIQAINKSGGKDESVLVTMAADAVDKQRAFVNKYSNILDLADKVGITEGSKASEIIFKALDYRRASPEEIATLTPEQQKFIPIFRNAYKEIWSATGKPEYAGIRDYATHLINDGLEKGYDVSPLGRFLPDELYSRFFEKRKGGSPYSQDIVKAFDVYVPSISRKIFREPVLDSYKALEPHLGVDFKNEAVDFMEAFLGRGRYKGQEVLGNLPRDLVRLTYQGTLYGNLSAATKNATQVLTNTIPEIGAKSTLYGYRRLMTQEGRREFINSRLVGDFTLGKPIDQLDFFSQVEFVNRGVTYLGAKQKALSEGKSLIEAENYAKKIVRKTQFIQTGIDTPKLYRQFGAVGRVVGQFTQFPTKQGFLLYNWARQGQWDKVARFATISYLLGGTRTVPFLDGVIDGDYKQLPQMPDDLKKAVRNVEKYTSLSGLSGMDIGQNFGFGIYSSGVPFARGPVASMVGAEIPRFIKGIATHEITNLQDIIRSRLVQKSLPTLIKGGSAMKKIIDLINADESEYKIRNAYNQLQYTSSPKEETLRILVGPTKERKESWESLSKEKQEAEIYRNEHRKMLDYTLGSKGDTLGIEEFIKKYPKYDTVNLDNELKNRIKTRELPARIREILNRPKALR